MNKGKRIITKTREYILKAKKDEPGKKIRVAAYCRVSTNAEDQLNSYHAQMSYYKKYIESNDNWEFVGIYADEGITCTRDRKRDAFLRMIQDCENGKIDIIITRSISRIATNIVDSLQFVRMLKSMGIAIYFEEQSINTLETVTPEFVNLTVQK